MRQRIGSRMANESLDMNDTKTFFYETEIEWSREKAGILHGPNLPAIAFGAPPEFKGRDGQWSPEHLLVASVNACFMLTLLAVAENSRVPMAGFSSTAKGKLEKVPGAGYQVTEIVIKPRIVIASAEHLEHMARILDKAKENCFITNSIKSVVNIQPEIYHQQTPASPCPFVH
jgi:organic hydroperoxide reductase OsmC/OhrA